MGRIRGYNDGVLAMNQADVQIGLRVEPPSQVEPQKVDRASLVLLRRAIGEGWAVPDAVLAHGGAIAQRILVDPSASNRDKTRALELLNKMRDSNIAAALALDKIERLNSGAATDIVFQVNKIEL